MTDQLDSYSTDEEVVGNGIASSMAHGDAKKKRKMNKLKKKEAKKIKRYKSTFQQIVKVTFLGSSILLISVAALRFTIVDLQSVHEAIMNFYFLFFGIVLVLQQLGLQVIKRNFRFLNYYWGKSVFCMFIGFSSLSNSQNQILQYISAALFFLLTIMFAITATCIDR